jgi:hypothetical protein
MADSLQPERRILNKERVVDRIANINMTKMTKTRTTSIVTSI